MVSNIPLASLGHPIPAEPRTTWNKEKGTTEKTLPISFSSVTWLATDVVRDNDMLEKSKEGPG